MRRPRPVLAKPREMKKAMTISQTLWLPKPLRVCGTVRVRVPARTVRASMTMAPSGSGLVRKPRMVQTKVTNTCQAWSVRPCGGGQNQSARKTTSTARPGLGFNWNSSDFMMISEDIGTSLHASLHANFLMVLPAVRSQRSVRLPRESFPRGSPMRKELRRLLLIVYERVVECAGFLPALVHVGRCSDQEAQ